eukprot:COSAG02_NODE_290_length_25531_cov_75.132392_5_plen_99_part_00
MLQMSYALCSWPEISPEKVMPTVPTPQQLLDWGDTGHRHQSGQLNYACPGMCSLTELIVYVSLHLYPYVNPHIVSCCHVSQLSQSLRCAKNASSTREH